VRRWREKTIFWHRIARLTNAGILDKPVTARARRGLTTLERLWLFFLEQSLSFQRSKFLGAHIKCSLGASRQCRGPISTGYITYCQPFRWRSSLWASCTCFSHLRAAETGPPNRWHEPSIQGRGTHCSFEFTFAHKQRQGIKDRGLSKKPFAGTRLCC
jgi:hypothetical protein